MRIFKGIFVVFVVGLISIASLGLAYYPNSESTDVVVYSASWCKYCAALKSHLNANRIPYKEYDVERSVIGALGYVVLRGDSVPLSVVGPDIVRGYDEPGYDESLSRLGYKVVAKGQ